MVNAAARAEQAAQASPGHPGEVITAGGPLERERHGVRCCEAASCHAPSSQRGSSTTAGSRITPWRNQHGEPLRLAFKARARTL